MPVTVRPESVTSVFTTLKVPTVASARAAISGMLPDETAGVRIAFTVKRKSSVLHVSDTSEIERNLN